MPALVLHPRSQPMAALLVLLLLSVPALHPRPAHAGEQLHIGFGGGVSGPVGAGAGAFDTGHHAHGFFKVKLPFAPLEPRLDVRYETMAVANATALNPPQDPTLAHSPRQNAFGGLFELQLDLATRMRFTPYIVGGIGTTQVGTRITFPQDNVYQNSVYGFTMAGGLGAEVHLGRVSAFAEAQYVHVNWKSSTNASWLAFHPTQTVPITLGLTL
jgi:opacity protein-like surface antigen